MLELISRFQQTLRLLEGCSLKKKKVVKVQERYLSSLSAEIGVWK
jgi:hypothetical protein